MFSVYTIGHSTHSIEDFLAILTTYGIQEIVDIRSFPQSRTNPQFNYDVLETTLKKHNIGYIHIKELGGFRKPQPDSINIGWKHPAFRGFADYMHTPEFEKGLNQLLIIAQAKRTAIMCAEALPWRCHRKLIGDALAIRGINVIDIISIQESRPHILPEGILIKGDHITYPKGIKTPSSRQRKQKAVK